MGALAARSAGVKRIVFTAHGWPFHESRSPLWLLIAWAGSVATAFLSDAIIAVSAKDRGASPTPWKTRLIRNGIPEIAFMPRDAARAEIELRAGRLVPKNAPWIGVVAELTKNKGVRYLIDAVTRVPSACFIVVGEGELRQELETLSRRRGLEGRVFFVGAMENAARILRAFDVFALPSLKEGLPYAVLEAMVAGLPIVATRVGGVPEEIEDGRSGIVVPPRDARALAKALERVIEDPALAGKLGDLARARVAEHFSLKRMVAETERVYGPD